MEQIAAIEKDIADWITMHLTIVILIGVGLFLTGRSLAVQVRLFPEMIRTVLDSRKGAEGGISSFQAFAISLAARVGIGNVFGVAAALLMGGPGAIFWMWVVALVGMATAFFEATLAQIFKVKHSDGSFRGGPAYYMKRGMKNRTLANIFAVITVITCGVVITSVQSNAIAGTLTSAFGEAAQQPLAGAGGFSAAQLTTKTTRTSQGVAVMTLKKKYVLDRALCLGQSPIQNPSRYRSRSLPAAGALLREEDTGETQVELEL